MNIRGIKMNIASTNNGTASRILPSWNNNGLIRGPCFVAQHPLCIYIFHHGHSESAPIFALHTARIGQIDQDTAAAWLDRAARHGRQVMLCLWQQLPVSECQLDELWSFVHTKEQTLFAAKLDCATYGDAWVWVAFAPIWRLVVALVVGKRTQASANLLLQRVAHLTGQRISFFASDQLADYRTALLEVYGQWYQEARNGSRGCFPKRRRVAPPDLGMHKWSSGASAGRWWQSRIRWYLAAPKRCGPAWRRRPPAPRSIPG